MNEIQTVKIIDYTYDGLGIGKVDGFPIFVDKGVVGETLKVKITKMKKNLAFADIVQVIKESDNRVRPVCEYYNECGGCHIMHMSYEEQLRFKTNHVEETLKRIGGVDIKVNDCVGMDNPYNYRNKLIIPFEGGKAGLYKKNTHDIIDIDKCYILNEEALEIVKYLKSSNLDLRNVLIRTSHNLDEIMVVLITYKKVKVDVVDELLSRFKGIVSIVNNINDKNTNVVLGSDSYVLYGNDYYKDYLLGNEYKINHRSFYQVNSIQTEKLYKKAIESINVEDKNVVDAYCGIGTIGLSFAKKARKVYGIEINESAVLAARENADLNNINNAEFYQGKAEKVISKVIDKKIDIVITDPPRKGCGEEFLQSLIDNDIKEVVYISCNVSTLARDIKYLSDYYDVLEVTPFDLFPHTYHVECVASLRKK
ncbi:23S rRNA (uracil(1939)-C(5))-methyltransferase RlmD [Mycoplasmatota bacterium WC44]